jgi:hypothetical protein
MFLRSFNVHGRPAQASKRPRVSTSPSLERTVQSGLNLFLRLKSPAQMRPLLLTIESVQHQIDAALAGLHYVHFARFLPSQDFSTLMVITVFDGDQKRYDESLDSYLMDFVATIGDEFTAMLEFIQNAPRLPVKQYPQDFLAFVRQNINPDVQPWSAYPDMTVIDIQNARSPR